jgi:PAS domain S-box-containing protein
MKMKDIIPDQCHSLHKQRLMAILNGEGTNTYAEYEVTGKDGIPHFVEIISVPYYKGKEIIGFQSITRDITERKLAEEELKKNQSQLINALKIAHLGSWEYDVENDIFIFNDLFYEIFRTTAEQVGGYTMSSADYAKRFVHPEDIDIIRTEISKSFETDDPDFSRQLEHRIIYADGETGYITVRFFIVKDETGKTVRTYGVNQDITERKRIEAELIKATELMKLAKEKAEASDRLKTTFLNNISHEVRTPLNGILGFAEIMSQTGLSEEEKNLSRSMLLESSDRLLTTITNYMDISLITSGSIIVNRKDFVPGQIMKELFGKYNTICSGRNIELLLKSPEHSDNLSINSDPEILNKIISQLLSNAIKYTEKGSIQYGFTIRENELEFFVKDTGIGIGKESIKSIFEHFIKEDRGPLKITEGSGLGLSISKGLVVHLGGKIWVESEKGKGSCFYFTIPVEKKIAEHILIPTAVRQTKNMKTNSILVAEDDEINFFYLKALLKQNTSAEIIHASNGKVALEKYLQNPDISLILMDIKMPVMDGLEATRQIKAINRSVPIIAITAYAMPGDENRITEAGCDYYLVKPINKKLLLDKIAEYTVL